MKYDLRNLVTGQELYFADATPPSYATEAQIHPYFGLAPSVSFVSLTPNGAQGWTAQVKHMGTEKQCAIAVGSETNPIDPTASDGEPVCQ